MAAARTEQPHAGSLDRHLRHRCRLPGCRVALAGQARSAGVVVHRWRERSLELVDRVGRRDCGVLCERILSPDRGHSGLATVPCHCRDNRCDVRRGAPPRRARTTCPPVRRCPTVRVVACTRRLVVTAARAADEPGSGAHFQIYGASPRSPLRWRLLSGNNRDIGRSADEFPNVVACHRAIDAVRWGLNDLDIALRRVGHEWTWLLLQADVPVVLAGHNYDRKIRCERALQQFVERAVLAPISANVIVSTSRRWTASPASRRLESARLTTERGRGAVRS
jgi:hypothetical protein